MAEGKWVSSQSALTVGRISRTRTHVSSSDMSLCGVLWGHFVVSCEKKSSFTSLRLSQCLNCPRVKLQDMICVATSSSAKLGSTVLTVGASSQVYKGQHHSFLSFLSTKETVTTTVKLITLVMQPVLQSHSLTPAILHFILQSIPRQSDHCLYSPQID